MSDPDDDLREMVARALVATDVRVSESKEADLYGQMADAALAVARPRIWEEAMEAAAKMADAEELTGDPPTDWNMDTIIAVQATVIATKCSIACAIRALSPPVKEGGHE